MGISTLDSAPINLQAIADMQNPPRARERCRQISMNALSKLQSNSAVIENLKLSLLRMLDQDKLKNFLKIQPS